MYQLRAGAHNRFLLRYIIKYLAIIEWGWVGYGEFCRSRRVLSAKVDNTLRDLQNSSYPTEAEFKIFKILSSLKLVNSTRGHFSLCWMTQPCAQDFSVNGSIIFDVNDSIICSGLHFWRYFDVNGSIFCSGLHFWSHWFNMTEFLDNSSCLWWIMRVVLTNQKRGNILNE